MDNGILDGWPRSKYTYVTAKGLSDLPVMTGFIVILNKLHLLCSSASGISFHLTGDYLSAI